MPEYLAPAVFVEETSFRAKSIDGVGTSTTAFVGMTGRGPVSRYPSDTTPPLLTSFTDFERYYGTVDNLVINGKPQLNYVALAARAFFSNGGGRLYVARILGANAAQGASFDLANPPADGSQGKDPKDIAFVTRRESGATYQVVIRQAELPVSKDRLASQPPGTLIRLKTKNDPSYFMADSPPGGNAVAADSDLAIVTVSIEVHQGPDIVYEAGGLGLHPDHPRYIDRIIGKTPPTAADALVNPLTIALKDKIAPADLRAGLMKNADPVTGARVVTVGGGSDGDGPPPTAAFQDALDSLLALEDISIVAAPGAAATSDYATVNQWLIAHAEARRSYRIAVLDPPPDLEVTGPQGMTGVKSRIDSKYAAIYYPWITIANPLAGSDPDQPTEIDVPPSGAVCGIYARSDIQRGVWKAPANETVTGAIGLQRDVRFGEQEVLNPLGVNCIRALPNRGIRVWGARTLSSDPEWKYVNVRRYFLYLESSIDHGTQWAVFEPNGEALWANVRSTVSDFLYNEWVSGALLGTKPEDAYFVRCDRTTMTQNDLDNGRLVCLIGVAALKPAEFVIFRIGQKTADARG